MSRALGRVVAAGLLAAGLAGCTGDGGNADRGPTLRETQSSVTPSSAPEPPRPADGACYEPSYDAALAPTSTSKPVSCKRSHTSQTFVVGTLDVVVDGHLLAVDSERARAQPARECPARFARFVGGSAEQRRLSLLKPTWFGPTVEESDDGQSWFRCDVVAVASPGALAPLSGRLRGVLDRPGGRDRYGLCAPDRPGAKRFAHVACSRDDAWRAIATVPVRAGKNGAWPGAARANGAGARCKDQARQGASDALSFMWGYEAPTRKQWSTGQRHGFCWVPRDN